MISGWYNDGYGLGVAPKITISVKPNSRPVTVKVNQTKPKEFCINKNQDEPYTDDGKYWFLSRRGISPYDMIYQKS